MANKVLVVGATGLLGSNVAEQLALAGIHTAALVRKTQAPSKKRQANLTRLEKAKVAIVEGELDSEEALALTLKQFDTVISAISGPDLVPGQLKLIDAAKKAGTIKRFVPSEFGVYWPMTGEAAETYSPAFKKLLENKKTVFEALQASGVPWTVILNYGLYSFLLPGLGQVGPLPIPDHVPIYAGGKARTFGTLEADVGRVLAKIVSDPRTLNKRVVIKANEFSQPDIVTAWEKVSGKQVEREDMSAEQYATSTKDASGMLAVVAAITKAIWIDGITTQEPEGGLHATELYPEIKFATPEQFFQQKV